MQALNRTIATLVALCIIGTACGDSSSDESATNTRAGTVETTSTAASAMPSSTGAPPTTSIAVTSTTTEEPPLPCEIESPSSEYDTTFYAKQCTVLGIAVLSSASVADAALYEAAKAITAMLATRPDLVEAMLGIGLRVGIIGKDEVTTDLPEHSQLDVQFPEVDWDTRTRGVAATTFIPLTSAGEENLLCLDSDVYRGESIFVHEFAHSVRLLGIARANPEVNQAIDDAYDAAIAGGLWSNTYAAANSDEYWAEAVQSYFDTNLSASPPDGIHNNVDTHAEVADYDPVIYGIITKVFGDVAWRYRCP